VIVDHCYYSLLIVKMSKLILVLLCALLACATLMSVSGSYLSVDAQADDILSSLEEQARFESEAALEEAEFHESESQSFLEAESESEAEADSDSDSEMEFAQTVDADAASEMVYPTIAQTDSATEMESVSSYSDASSKTDMQSAIYSDMETAALLEVGGDDEAGENPSYTLPYPPVLPGHYTPLFNPYSNVNPLSTPFANYAAQPGGHPGVAAAAAAQAGGLAAINGQIAGAAGGFPFVNPGFVGLQGNPVPFSGYAGWIHPQNLNSASVGENSDAESLGQFIEVATEENDHGECQGCSY